MRMVQARLLFSLWLQLSALGLAALAARDAEPASAGAAQKFKEFGNRWEGLVAEENALDEYRAVSFYSYKEDYPPRGNTSLSVMFYSEDDAFEVKSAELDVLKQYQMRAKRNAIAKRPGLWRLFSGWDTRDVLLAEEVPSQNLGVLVHLGSGDAANRRLSPAMVFSGQPPPPISTYTLVMKFDESIERLKPAMVCGESRAEGRAARMGQGRVSARQPITITFATAGLAEGQCLITLDWMRANATGDRSRHVEYSFPHKKP
jgi:hypothetical protein